MLENKKKKSVELPLAEPIYSTYNYQAGNSAITLINPEMRNHFLNSAVNLVCRRRFLFGYTTPNINVVGSNYKDNPYLESVLIPTKYLGNGACRVIKRFLDDGWYVGFRGVDDYYVKGKSWYHQKHFPHDGMVCGYDDEKRTFSIYSYDSSWIIRRFETTQHCFETAIKSGLEYTTDCHICAYRPQKAEITLDVRKIYDEIKNYVSSDFRSYRPTVNKKAYGIIVQEYMVMYLDKLHDGSIPHSRMDRRIFRMIWEHKKVMLERIRAVEAELVLDGESGEKYEKLVKAADDIRMLYAAYNLKERPELLTVIREKLLKLRLREEKILKEFLEKMEEAMDN